MSLTEEFILTIKDMKKGLFYVELMNFAVKIDLLPVE